MPNGLWPARDDTPMRAAIPSSKFSKGDLLVYDSSSSLSRADVGTNLGAGDLAGVAAADSDQSRGDKVPFYTLEKDSVFWSDATPNSHYTPGEEFDFDTDGNGRPVLTTSQNTVRFVVLVDSNDIEGQSVQSRVLGQVIRHAGNVEHS